MIYIVYDKQTGKVNQLAYSQLNMIDQGASYLEISEEIWADAQGKEMKVENGQFIYSDPLPTVDDYDKAMEDHLKEQRIKRGYTIRQPSDYKDDPYERFAQDAIDWINHRSEVMIYGLQIQNDYKEGKEVPSLEEFKEKLPKISWTFNDESQNSESSNSSYEVQII